MTSPYEYSSQHGAPPPQPAQSGVAGAYTGAPPPTPSMPASRVPALHITTAAPASIPVTAASCIPVPASLVPGPHPSQPGLQAPTSTPLLAVLGQGQAPPAHVSTGSTPVSALDSASTPATAQSNPPRAERRHSFDDCPACRAEYAAAVAASLSTDAERRRIEEERERRELEDAIRLSEQEAAAASHGQPNAENEDEEEQLRRALEESARNAALEEERRRQWAQAASTSATTVASSSAQPLNEGQNQDEAEAELIRRAIEESARAEEETRRRRAQQEELEASILEQSRRTAELAEHQRYLEIQEASMWRSPDAGSRASSGGGGASSSSKACEAYALGASHSNEVSSTSTPGVGVGVTGAEASFSDTHETSKTSNGEKEDYSLGLGLRASRRSQELPAGMDQEEFARAIANEVRARMEQRRSPALEVGSFHSGGGGGGGATPGTGDRAGRTTRTSVRSQEEEDSFWRRPDEVQAARLSPSAIAGRKEAAQSLPPLPSPSSGGRGSAQNVGILPVHFGTAQPAQGVDASAVSSSSKHHLDVPDSVGESLAPTSPSREDERHLGGHLEDADHSLTNQEGKVADEQGPTSAAPTEEHGPAQYLPPSTDVPSASITVPITKSRPLPIPPGPPPAGVTPATFALAHASPSFLPSLALHAAETGHPAHAQQPRSFRGNDAEQEPRSAADAYQPSTSEVRAEAAVEPVRPQADAPVDVDGESITAASAQSSAGKRGSSGPNGDDAAIARLTVSTQDDEQGDRSAASQEGPTAHGMAGTPAGDDGQADETDEPSPPSYALVDPDPDASLRAPSMTLSRSQAHSPSPSSPLQPSGISAAGSTRESASMRRHVSGAPSVVSGDESSALGVGSVGGGTNANPLLAGMSYPHTTPASILPSATLGGAGVASGTSPLLGQERWSYSAGSASSTHGSGPVSSGGHVVGQNSNGSSIQALGGTGSPSGSGAGRWSGEPQIAVALRRGSAAMMPSSSSASSSHSHSHSLSQSHSHSHSRTHSSSFSATPSQRGSIISAGAGIGVGVSGARTTTGTIGPASTLSINPLFSAFGAEAEDVHRVAAAAAASAPPTALPREHGGGWVDGADPASRPVSRVGGTMGVQQQESTGVPVPPFGTPAPLSATTMSLSGSGSGPGSQPLPVAAITDSFSIPASPPATQASSSTATNPHPSTTSVSASSKTKKKLKSLFSRPLYHQADGPGPGTSTESTATPSSSSTKVGLGGRLLGKSHRHSIAGAITPTPSAASTGGGRGPKGPSSALDSIPPYDGTSPSADALEYGETLSQARMDAADHRASGVASKRFSYQGGGTGGTTATHAAWHRLGGTYEYSFGPLQGGSSGTGAVANADESLEELRDPATLATPATARHALDSEY